MITITPKYLSPVDGNIPCKSPVISFGSLISFLIGFASIYEFSIIGRLSAQEFLVAVLAPILLFTKHEPFSRVTKWLMGAVIFWLVIQLFTDLIRSIPYTDMARGCARIVFFGFALLTFSILLKKDATRIAMFMIGAGLSSVVSYFIFPNELGYVDAWKWYFADATTLCAIALLCWSRIGQHVTYWVLILGSIIIISGLQNYRSHAAILLATVVYLIFNKVFLKLPFIGRICLVVTSGFLLLFLYFSLATSGVLGDKARDKLAMQYSEDKGIYSIITGGRIEYRASMQAISDSPIVGYGSWAQHPEYAYLLIGEDMDSATVAGFEDTVALGIIPTHSYFFGAWVDGGLLPALLWALIWLACLYLLLSIRTWTDWLPKLGLFLAIGLLWNIAFSPFGVGARVKAAFSIAVIIDCWRYWAPRGIRKYFVDYVRGRDS